MPDLKKSPEIIRQNFRTRLASGKLLQFPGAFSPLAAKLIENKGFDGVYISGAILSADLGLPDIGLTTLTEVCHRGGQIARVLSCPTLIDLDTGFGSVLNMGRSIELAIQAGISGCHIEDQVNPKRCGHLDGKQVVSTKDMVQRIQAAVNARNDPNFLIMARTDARDLEGLDAAIDRAKAYIDAGADAIFPEALANEAEFEAFRKAISVPLLANMTEFGKSKILDKTTLESLGYNLVIYPVSTLRVAMKATEKLLDSILVNGSQAQQIDQMQTRSELYQLLEYDSYNSLDQSIYNFKLKDHT
jgi:methylisocitrate lyase